MTTYEEYQKRYQTWMETQKKEATAGAEEAVDAKEKELPAMKAIRQETMDQFYRLNQAKRKQKRNPGGSITNRPFTPAEVTSSPIPGHTDNEIEDSSDLPGLNTGRIVDLSITQTTIPTIPQPAGLINKYTIAHTDGTPLDEGAEYFVLRIDPNQGDMVHYDACMYALMEYATRIMWKLPELAKDLEERFITPWTMERRMKEKPANTSAKWVTFDPTPDPGQTGVTAWEAEYDQYYGQPNLEKPIE